MNIDLDAIEAAASAAMPGPFESLPVEMTDERIRFIAICHPQAVLDLCRIARAASAYADGREVWLRDDGAEYERKAKAMHDAESALDDALHDAGLL